MQPPYRSDVFSGTRWEDGEEGIGNHPDTRGDDTLWAAPVTQLFKRFRGSLTADLDVGPVRGQTRRDVERRVEQGSAGVRLANLDDGKPSPLPGSVLPVN